MDPLTYLAVAVVLNIPFGMWRARTRKLSVAWFAAIHAPIPGIILLRFALDVSWAWVPAGIACAVVGQIAGARVSPWRHIGRARDAEHKAAREARASVAGADAA